MKIKKVKIQYIILICSIVGMSCTDVDPLVVLKDKTAVVEAYIYANQPVDSIHIDTVYILC